MNAIWVAVVTPLVTFFLSIAGLAGFTAYAVFRLNSPQIIREKIWNACFVIGKWQSDKRYLRSGSRQAATISFHVLSHFGARPTEIACGRIRAPEREVKPIVVVVATAFHVDVLDQSTFHQGK